MYKTLLNSFVKIFVTDSSFNILFLGADRRNFLLFLIVPKKKFLVWSYLLSGRVKWFYSVFLIWIPHLLRLFEGINAFIERYCSDNFKKSSQNI